MLSITIAFSSKKEEFGGESWPVAAWQGFKIMRLANFQKGSVAVKQVCFTTASFCAMIAFGNGLKALGIRSATIQGGRQRVDSKWSQGAPRKQGERCMEDTSFWGLRGGTDQSVTRGLPRCHSSASILTEYGGELLLPHSLPGTGNLGLVGVC